MFRVMAANACRYAAAFILPFFHFSLTGCTGCLSLFHSAAAQRAALRWLWLPGQLHHDRRCKSVGTLQRRRGRNCRRATRHLLCAVMR